MEKVILKKKSDKKIPQQEAFFEDIFVCKDETFRPYIEILVQEPENVSQQPLGTLCGVFEITDDSEDSSYIVNYLISVIKKEYFSKTKRPPIESFEAALHHANVALSKLAEHGNVNWIGKINAIIAVTEKNNLHFSQAGTASALLLRSNILTDISEGLAAADPEPHPLKTFVNVSSGRLQSDDKIIIATESIFDIFSLEEVKKSALRFSRDKFSRFLRTALANELPRAAVLLVDIKQKTESDAPEKESRPDTLNAFSGNTYSRASTTPQRAVPPEPDIHSAVNQTEGRQGKTEGHIYIKESEANSVENIEVISERSIILQETVSTILNAYKRLCRSIGRLMTALAKKSSESVAFLQRKISEKRAEAKAAEISKSVELAAPITVDSDSFFAAQPTRKEKTEATPKFSQMLARYLDFLKELLRSTNRKFSEFAESHRPKTAPQENRNQHIIFSLPTFSRLKNLFFALNKQQKIFASSIIFLIIFGPIVILRIGEWQRSKNTPGQTVSAPILVPLENDKAVIRLGELSPVFSGNDIRSVKNVDGKIMIIDGSEIIDWQTKESFAIPSGFAKPEKVSEMKDLNLIFIVNERNELMTFSPVSKKFQTNSIYFPDGAEISAIGTYLTYLYAIDSEHDQIYRYPRATGGFGERTDWLKEAIQFDSVSDMALTEEIFIADSSRITKLFKGKKQDFNLEQSATPIAVKKLFAWLEDGRLFVLDQKNSRLIMADAANGEIRKQFYSEQFSSAITFTIDVSSGTAFVATPRDLYSFPIN